jgi:hypothetical protein
LVDPRDFAAPLPLMKIAERTSHRSPSMLQVYSRQIDLLRDHTGAAFL